MSFASIPGDRTRTCHLSKSAGHARGQSGDFVRRWSRGSIQREPLVRVPLPRPGENQDFSEELTKEMVSESFTTCSTMLHNDEPMADQSYLHATTRARRPSSCRRSPSLN